MIPVLAMAAGNKGGVGKTMFTRNFLEYPQIKNLNPRLYDTEDNAHNLKRYYPQAEMIDITAVNDQMKLFDNLQGLTVVDIKAGLLTPVLKSMRELGLLHRTDYKLVLLHVIGGSISSLEEIAETSAQLDENAVHMLVKNFISDSQFFEFDNLVKSKYYGLLDITDVITMGHLPGRAQEDLDLSGLTIQNYINDPKYSKTLRGYVNFWMQNTHNEITRVGLMKRMGL